MDGYWLKPYGIMKTLSGTFMLVALAAVAIGSILTFRLFAQSPTPTSLKYTLEISNKTSTTDALPVQDIAKFKTLLTKPGMQSDVTFTSSQKAGTPGSYSDKTGVNVTQRVTTNDATDFLNVLASFGSPTLSPTAKPTATP